MEKIGLSKGIVRLISYCRYYPNMAAKLLMRIGSNPIDLPYYQQLILLLVWNKLSPIIVMTRGGGKTFIQSVIQILNSLLYKRKKAGCIGPGFRQAKLVFQEADDIVNESPLLKQAIYKGPTYKTDLCYINWRHRGLVNAIPLGGGEKIRGMRFHYIGVDELAQVPKDILDVVVRGFAATVQDPMKNVRRIEKEKELLAKGIKVKKRIDVENKVAGFSTAYYQFNHLWETVQKNISIIQSQFTKAPIKGYDDYVILKISYNKLPEGFLSDKQINISKNEMSSYEFAMEFACFAYDTEIITDRGLKSISNISIGDNVLTHNGRFKKVNNVMQRYYSGKIVDFISFGYNKRIKATINHKFFNGNKWKEIGELIHDKRLYLSNLKSVNGNNQIDLYKYTEDVLCSCVNGEWYIYPILSQYNKSKIRSISGKEKIFKSSIKRYIELDYNFGLIVGYYASKGCVSAYGRATVFSLDGHEDIKLKKFISELENAILSVFNKKPKKYYKENICNININSRPIADLFKKICPGVSNTKIIDPKILYSNEDFMKGFLVGYWHGDGCINNKPQAIAGCINKNLLSQIRVVLSFFGFSSSLRYSRGESTVFISGKLFNTKPVYELSMKGDTAREFNHFINGTFMKKRISDKRSINIKNENGGSVFKIRDYEIYDYNGLVYNISVDDDHSYCIANSTVSNCFFPPDSEGFFKMSLLDNAKSSRVKFKYFGDSNKEYVLAIDPARKSDNCAFAVGEIGAVGDSNIIVCVETINNKSYGVMHSKILEILDRYNIISIAIDQGGGGTTIKDNLCDEEKMSGRSLIYDVDDSNSYINGLISRPKKGLHILRMINFVPSWIAEANYNLLSDLEHRRIVFARNPDDVEIEKATEVEAAWIENEEEEMMEAKREMSKIIVTASARGIPHWDTQNKKDRKDRYSAILILNDQIRKIKEKIKNDEQKSIADGGWAENFVGSQDIDYYDAAALA